MAAADGVEIVGLRRIAFLVGCLDAAFGHARIGIAHAQFRRHEDLGAVPCRFDGSRRTGAATADDQTSVSNWMWSKSTSAVSMRLLPCSRASSSFGTLSPLLGPTDRTAKPSSW